MNVVQNPSRGKSRPRSATLNKIYMATDHSLSHFFFCSDKLPTVVMYNYKEADWHLFLQHTEREVDIPPYVTRSWINTKVRDIVKLIQEGVSKCCPKLYKLSLIHI